MLLLSSHAEDALPRGAAVGQQQGKTVYHVSVVLNGDPGDELGPGPETERGPGQADGRQPGESSRAGARAQGAESSLGQSRARRELGRWPSLSRTGRAMRRREEVVMEEEEEVEVEGERIETDRLDRKSTRLNSSH